MEHGGPGTAGDGDNNGGAGGNAVISDWISAAGVGNPAGTSSSSAASNVSGTGGLLIIYSKNMNNNGIIEANGVTSTAAYRGNGGSSGGGSVNIFVENNYTGSTENIIANGGSGSITMTTTMNTSGNITPGAGGTGSISVGKIVNGIYTNIYKNYLDSMRTVLDYPLITTSGIVNVKYTNPENEKDYSYVLDKSINCTASNALSTAAFDGDLETCDDRSNTDKIVKMQKGVDPYCILIRIPDSFTSGRVITDPRGYFNYNEGTRFTSGKYSGYWHQTFYSKGVSTYTEDRFWRILPTVYEICYDADI